MAKTESLTPEQIAKLQEENAALLAENSLLKKGAELEPAIKEKMAAGLTRPQAEAVVKAQAEHDAWLAKQEADQKKAAKK